MNSEQNNLPLEKQVELERVKTHFAFLNSLLMQRAAIIPVIASLSAMALVVATFNENLLPLTGDIKVAIVILLMLIPTSILFSVLEIHFAINTTVKAINEIAGSNELFNSKTTLGKLKTILLAHTPLFLGAVLSFIIIWIILVILGFVK